MGSFAGHIDEAIFFLMLGLWWMYNQFVAHIRSRWQKTEFTSRVSYPLPCCRRYIALESILKILFPFAGLVGEIWSGGPDLYDADGNFRKVSNMQHMSIYALFMVHGVIDLLMSYGVPFPKGLDYLSALLAFAWYGLSFSFHAHMHGKPMMETTIHVLPIYILAACVGAGVWEVLQPHCFLAPLLRTYCMLVLGSWFFHIAFIMYIPYPFPGRTPNPRWDQHDERNMSAIVAIFGFHLIAQLCVISVGYLTAYAALRLRGEGRCQFKPLLNKEPSEEEV